MSSKNGRELSKKGTVPKREGQEVGKVGGGGRKRKSQKWQGHKRKLPFMGGEYILGNVEPRDRTLSVWGVPKRGRVTKGHTV